VAKVEELLPLVEKYGAAYERKRKLIADLPEKLRKSILQEAIQGKLVPQDPKDEPADILLNRIAKEKSKATPKGRARTPSAPQPITEEEKPFDLPKGWTWVRIAELGVFYGGHTPSLAEPSFWGGSYLWISSKDMKGKYIYDTGDKLTKKGCDELRLLREETLIFTTRSGILKHTFPVAILKKPSTINQDQRALVLYDPSLAEYVYLAVKGQERHILRDLTKRGTTVQSVLWDDFIRLLIPLPPLAEQKRIVAKVEELLADVGQLQKSIFSCGKQR